MYKFFSQLGRALMLPIAVLPIAGLLLGIGSAFTADSTVAMMPFLQNDIVKAIFNLMKIAGNAVFANIALIFAIGIAVGFAKEDRGVAGLSSVISFLIFKAVSVSMGKDFFDIANLDTGVLGALAVGLTVAALHNKFHRIQLPQVLGFFSGNRFIPIVAGLAGILLGVIFAAIWSFVFPALVAAGEAIAKMGPVGSFFYGFFMRLLGALGLHHAIYPMFWYTELGGSEMVNGTMIVGAQNIYFAQMADPNHTGLYTYGTRFFAGRFPTMMFGVPAAALAMYLAIPKKNRPKYKGLYFSGGLTSFLTGITEPVEYTFLFVAPWLYFIHCVLDGLSFLVMDVLMVRIGNAFSGGFIEYLLFGVLQGNDRSNFVLVLIVGVVWALLYFVIFYFCVKKFKVPVPGMLDEDGPIETGKNALLGKTVSKEEKLHNQSLDIIKALGNAENIEVVSACATRLRVTVKEDEKVDTTALKKTGAIAVINKKGAIQAVYGTKADLLSTEINTILKDGDIDVKES